MLCSADKQIRRDKLEDYKRMENIFIKKASQAVDFIRNTVNFDQVTID